MIDPIDASLRIAGAGLPAQSTRVRIVSENLANAQSTGRTPGSDPYRRKTVTFENMMDGALGAAQVQVKGVGVGDDLGIGAGAFDREEDVFDGFTVELHVAGDDVVVLVRVDLVSLSGPRTECGEGQGCQKQAK